MLAYQWSMVNGHVLKRFGTFLQLPLQHTNKS